GWLKVRSAGVSAAPALAAGSKNSSASAKPPTRGPGGDEGLAYRRRVLQAALHPQRVQPARNLQRRPLAEIPLEALAVIPDMLDDSIGPVVGEAERFAVLAFGAKEPLRLRLVGFLLFVHIRFG